MTRTRRRFLGTVTATAGIGLAGCLGDGDDDGTGDGQDGATPTATATETETDSGDDGSGDGADGATVQVRSHPEHGAILVGPEGMTVYNFDQDEQGADASACPDVDGCDETWPPLSVEEAGDVTTGEGVEIELSTFEREDGTIQVTANGWPLYYYAPDEAPGDAAGQGANDVWWVMSPGGEPQRPEAATVAVASTDEHGDVLVDGDGMTLYMFDSDEQGAGASTCYDGCADNWPPLTTDTDPESGDGVTAELATFEREDGSMQVSANGWPLYYFASDAEPGDVEGQGVNDVWWVLAPDGEPRRPDQDGQGLQGGSGGSSGSSY